VESILKLKLDKISILTKGQDLNDDYSCQKHSFFRLFTNDKVRPDFELGKKKITVWVRKSNVFYLSDLSIIFKWFWRFITLINT
jgi:hypothetical protein